MHSIRSHFIILLCTLLAALPASASPKKSPSAYDIYQKPFYLENHKGQTLVVNYWSETCGPCIEEIPEMNTLANLGPKNNFTLVAVNINRLPPEDQKAFASMHQVNYKLLQDNPVRGLDLDGAVEVLPTTFIISPTGKVDKLEGEHTSTEILQAILAL